MAPVAAATLADAVEVDRSAVTVGRGRAGIPVEGLCSAGHLERQQPRDGGEDGERVGDTPRRQPHGAGGDASLVAVDVHVELALEHVDRLVGLGVAMPRRHLPIRQLVLEEEEGTIAVLGRDLPGVHAAPGEPALVAFAGLAHHRLRCHVVTFRGKTAIS